MKKKGFLFLFLFLILFLSLVSAADNDTEQTKVNKAYQCLTDKVSGKCASLSSEEKVFSALSTGNCRSDLSGDSNFKNNVKYTSQSVLAMNGNSDAESWLLSKNITPTELAWFLEVESSEPASCSIQYSGQSYTVDIDENKKLSSNAGNCLTLAQDGYWLRVSPSCYSTEFSVSCSQSFLTTLLFKKSTSSTIHVSGKTSSASSGGTTKEKVESFCFAQGTSCDYESSLWAALALDSRGKDVSPYLPYLITLADENQRFLPESFLYTLTGNSEYKISLLSKQKSSQWWMESGDKFYDTALALYPLQSETPQEKTNAKNWLLSSQDSNGCWEGNIRNTGFILASIWPKSVGGSTELPDCENAGYYCTTTSSCNGEVLSEFDCPGSLQKCCTTKPIVETCAEQGGDICTSNKICSGGTSVDASDLRTGEICCAGGGVCATRQESSECDINNGICRAGGCADNEQETVYSCDFSGDSCCVLKSSSGKSYWWIWVLLILITLVVLGIIFRNRLRMLWFRMRSGGKSTGPRPPTRPSYPPPGYQRPMMRPPERRILIPQVIRRPIARATSGAQKELDEVLKKLKDMSK